MTLPREARVGIEDAEASQYLLGRLAKMIEDVHVLAYEPHVARDGQPRSRKQTWYLDDVGLREAKDALRALLHQHSQSGLKAIRMTLEAHVASFDSLFSGPGADSTMRGTLLGDERGNGAQKELTARIQNQAKQKTLGLYVPERSEPQPKRVPGA